MVAVCDYCGKEFHTKRSAYARKIRHFCGQMCYSAFRRERLPFYEQPAYGGVRQPTESKQVYHRNYCARHRANIAHLKARRYAVECGASGQHTKADWDVLKGLFCYRCAFCGKKKLLTKDHITPLSEGGTDDIGNIQPLCRSCNSRKHIHIIGQPVLAIL